VIVRWSHARPGKMVLIGAPRHFGLAHCSQTRASKSGLSCLPCLGSGKVVGDWRNVSFAFVLSLLNQILFFQREFQSFHLQQHYQQPSRSTARLTDGKSRILGAEFTGSRLRIRSPAGLCIPPGSRLKNKTKHPRSLRRCLPRRRYGETREQEKHDRLSRRTSRRT
jgi:hypothetical protein